jgi:RHS repeat-associated protein
VLVTDLSAPGDHVVFRAAYYPYGEKTDGAERLDNASYPFQPKYRFNFKERESPCIYDYGARLYDACTGRFLSADTSTQDGLNRYAYVRNNPLRFNDPTGHASGDWELPEQAATDSIPDKASPKPASTAESGCVPGTLMEKKRKAFGEQTFDYSSESLVKGRTVRLTKPYEPGTEVVLTHPTTANSAIMVYGGDWCYEASTNSVRLLRTPARFYGFGGAAGDPVPEGALIWIYYGVRELKPDVHVTLKFGSIVEEPTPDVHVTIKYGSIVEEPTPDVHPAIKEGPPVQEPKPDVARPDPNR